MPKTPTTKVFLISDGGCAQLDDDTSPDVDRVRINVDRTAMYVEFRAELMPHLVPLFQEAGLISNPFPPAK